MAVVLETRGLTRKYRAGESSFTALDNLNLLVEAGEFIVITGPSGCGKSTLLHLLAGLDKPTSGEVLLKGRRIDHLSETRLAILRRKEVGFVFQFFNLVGNLSVADNIELPALLAGNSLHEARTRRQELLTELALDSKAASVPSHLSGGQQQRVALARALVNRPAILLADEPTGNLDSKSAGEVLRLLERYHRQGQTILLVTHDLLLAQLAQRVIIMQDGRIIEEQLNSTRPGPFYGKEHRV